MEKCRKCGSEFDPNDLPPSLRQTLKRCKKCYKRVKKNADKLWFISQGLTRRKYETKLRQEKDRKFWKGKINRS